MNIFFSIIFTLLLIGCNKKLEQDDKQTFTNEIEQKKISIVESNKVSNEDLYNIGSNEIPSNKASNEDLYNVGSNEIPSNKVSNEDLYNDEYKDLNALIEKYVELYDKSVEIGESELFLKSVDSINQFNREEIANKIRSEIWSESRLNKPTVSLSNEIKQQLYNGGIIKLPKEGVLLDLNMDGIEESITFCYNPDTTHHQDYIVRINEIDGKNTAVDPTGDIYAVILGSKEKKQVFILVEEKGPHGEIPFTYFWSFSNDEPYYVTGIWGRPIDYIIDNQDEDIIITGYDYYYENGTSTKVKQNYQIQYLLNDDGIEVPELIPIDKDVD